jgi:hypothetical protein
MSPLEVVCAVIVLIVLWLIWHEVRLTRAESQIAKVPELMVHLTANFQRRVAKEVDRVLGVKVDRKMDDYIAETKAELDRAQRRGSDGEGA